MANKLMLLILLVAKKQGECNYVQANFDKLFGLIDVSAFAFLANKQYWRKI